MNTHFTFPYKRFAFVGIILLRSICIYHCICGTRAQVLFQRSTRGFALTNRELEMVNTRAAETLKKKVNSIQSDSNPRKTTYKTSPDSSWFRTKEQ